MVDDAMGKDGLSEKVRISHDKSRMFVCMATLTLKSGFSSAKSMEKALDIKVANNEILALLLSIFYIMQFNLYIERILDDEISSRLPQKLIEEILTQLKLERELIFDLYSKKYDEALIKKIINESIFIFSKEDTPPNELFLNMLLKYQELYLNDKFLSNMSNNISLVTYSITHYTTIIPAYFESMSLIIEHFYGYSLPIADHDTKN